MSGPFTLTVRYTRRVLPERPSSEAMLALSTADRAMFPCYAPVLLLFARPLCADALERSLAAVLSAFWPLAGSVADGGRSLANNGTGVELSAASSTARLEDFGDDCDVFAHAAFEQDLVPTPHALASVHDGTSPAAFARVTELADGTGTALGVSVHHALVDGRALFDFVRCWAAASRGAPAPLVPLHDRLLLDRTARADTAGAAQEAFRGLVPHTPIERREFFAHAAAPPADAFPATVVVVAYTREELARLKAAAGARSAYDAQVALVWKVFVDARGLRDEETTSVGMACDARDRLRPALPAEWWGCANTYALVPAITAAEVRAASLEELAARVRSSVDAQGSGCTAATLRMAADALLEGKVLDPAWSASRGDFAVTSTAGCDYYAEGVADFGAGAPMVVCPPRQAGMSLAMIQARRDGGSRIYIHATAPEARKLSTPEFKSRFQPWC